MILLKNGFIVDGTGSKGYTGNLLVNGDVIGDLSEGPIPADCESIDCSGKVIAPGFIDLHSHNDWFLPSGNADFTKSFLEQGITTFVGGNCGFGAAGFRKDTRYLELLENNLFKAGHGGIAWRSLDEYFSRLEEKGMTHNLAMLAGHGTTRASIKGYDPSPMSGGEGDEIIRLLDEAMEQGARGVSFGMGYAPDIFSTPEEQARVAETVKKHDGIITVHVRAFSKISGAYPLKPFGKPHNIIALEEWINLARKTGVRLQISHLIFVGKRTWPTLEKALGLIDGAIHDGLDVRFDTYAHHCGATVITGILPEWFMAEVPAAYDDKKMLKKTRMLMKISFALLGFNTSDMRLASANHPDLDRYNGMFLSDIARERGMNDFDNYIDLAKKSDSTARMLLNKYSNDHIIEELMKHPASNFMTDAWIEPSGLQNPAAFGCFPAFLGIAREKGAITLEAAVNKMTGANAERMKIRDRGLLKKGMAADITVFDWNAVGDSPDGGRPSGIDRVFLNGVSVVTGGVADEKARAGRVIR